MPYYRLYFFDPSDHITAFREYDAPDDNRARALASGYADEAPLELWSGGRKIERIPLAAPDPRLDSMSNDRSRRSAAA